MKTRLTITLPPDLLKTIDAFVDKKTIRNRSHAIEHLVRKSLGSQVTTAVILAGGSRSNATHPLLKKIGESYLFHCQLDNLKKYGVKNIILSLQETDQHLEDVFGDGSAQGVSISYSYDRTRLGTAGALKHALKLLPHQAAVIVLHGDVLTNIALDELIAFHQAEEADVTLAVKPRIGKRELGQVYLQGSRVTTFTKNSVESEISIINTGVYIINHEVIASIPNKKPLYLESDVFPHLAEQNKVRAFIFQGIWYDVSTDDQYQQAQKRWSFSK